MEQTVRQRRALQRAAAEPSCVYCDRTLVPRKTHINLAPVALAMLIVVTVGGLLYIAIRSIFE